MSDDDTGLGFGSVVGDLSQSMERAFDFSSDSGSPHPLRVPRALSVPADMLASSSSPSSSSRGSLITEFKAVDIASSSPKVSSKQAAMAHALLEAFLEDETPIKLSNIPMRHSSSSLLSVGPKVVTSPPPQAHLSTLIKREDGTYLYTIASSDTLEGLALRFGVKVAELKKVNKLFNSRDFGIRKTFIIPLTDELYAQYLKELERHQQREDSRRQEVVSLFVEKVHASEEVATVYLSHTHYNLERAIDRYRLDHSTTTEPLDIRQTSKPIFSSNSSSLRARTPTDGGETVQRLSRSNQERADDLFDL